MEHIQFWRIFDAGFHIIVSVSHVWHSKIVCGLTVWWHYSC